MYISLSRPQIEAVSFLCHSFYNWANQKTEKTIKNQKKKRQNPSKILVNFLVKLSYAKFRIIKILDIFIISCVTIVMKAISSFM